MLNLALRLCQAVVLMPSRFPRFGQSLGLIEWHWRQMVFVYVSLTAAQQSCLLDPDLQVQSCFCHRPLRLCCDIAIGTAEHLRCNALCKSYLFVFGAKSCRVIVSSPLPCLVSSASWVVQALCAEQLVGSQSSSIMLQQAALIYSCHPGMGCQAGNPDCALADLSVVVAACIANG